MVTQEKAQELIDSSRPARGFFTTPRLILLSLIFLLTFSLIAPERFGGSHPLLNLVPYLIMLGLFGIIGYTFHRQRKLSRLMLQGMEAVQLKEWQKAFDKLTELLQHPLRHERARAEALLALAQVAESGNNYEAAQHIYDAMLDEDTGDSLQLHNARIGRAAAMLRNGQTTDAIQLIDKLVRKDLPAPLKAQAELLSLFREVYMGQTHDSIEKAEIRRTLFRKYLSTRAGYGYALQAAAFHRENLPEKARQYWQDATLLVRPDELLNRFEELKKVAESYPAVEFQL